jgi:uncharacterized protein YyaL (SSP411 family)
MKNADTPKHTNRLAEASSPYLLQHQHNPVNWYPWGEEALQKAKQENKPIIVSIGYSACHWCHVMERESFEDEQVARLMNQHYICIKVDREERPDVDQIYMDAVQAMGLQGGWPLNVFLTTDQKPFYGGTYFPKQNWMQLLNSIAVAYRQNQEDLEESAEKFAESLSASESRKYGLSPWDADFSREELQSLFNNFSKHFDTKKGGLQGAPKFPMPSHWLFLLRCWAATGRQEALEQARLTLAEMAWGGLYDQLGGGFARYSVDADWFAPHFEKMLYDNGQLLSLYAEAYTATRDLLFKKVVYQTVEWAEREMLSPEGGFYAALDADSEGEEGKYYVWTYQEIENILGPETELFCDFYNVDEQGNWEQGKNILFRRESSLDFARKYELDPLELEDLLLEAEEKLFKAREQRTRPGLDDKILAGWNGLMLSGLADAYAAFGEGRFLDLALKNARFLEQHMLQKGKLMRNYKNGKAGIDGYLEDYAFVIHGFMRLYEVCFDAHWLYKARDLTKYCLAHFWDDTEKLFFYTDSSSEKLIARKKEIFDNVIPASNAAMAMNLHRLGLLLDIRRYQKLAATMLSTVHKLLVAETPYFTYWACLYTQLATPTAEIAIVGPDFQAFARTINQQSYHPNKVLCASADGAELPLLENREAEGGDTTIYVCYKQSCQRPVHSPAEALELL